jgi:predicted DNA-binding ribbon-helix-helix protein
MKSPVAKRSIIVGGHKTSVSLEEPFWSGMKEISSARSTTLSELVSAIDKDRQQGNLSSAIRLFVLDHYKGGTMDRTSGSRPRAGHAQGPAESVLNEGS